MQIDPFDIWIILSITLRTFKSSEILICHFWEWQRRCLIWNICLDPLKFQYVRWRYELNKIVLDDDNHPCAM